MRNTIAVATLKNKVNDILRESLPEMKESRMALMTLIESVLFETDNYMGFRYLEAEYDGNEVVTLGDETRRQYY